MAQDGILPDLRAPLMPKVKEVRNPPHMGHPLHFSESVFIDFEDGVTAEFMPYRESLGYDIDGLRWFRLWRGSELLSQYACILGRVQRAHGEEHRFSFLADGFPQQHAAEYWEAARDRVNELYYGKAALERRERPRELWLAWLVTHSCAHDLKLMKEGRADLHPDIRR